MIYKKVIKLRKSIIPIILILLLASALTVLASSTSPLPYKPTQGCTVWNDYTQVMKANGKLLFITTSGDYFQNEEYYNKKFGLGKYWREDHRPVEPDDIEYKPHLSAIKKDYPKVYITEGNKN